MSLADITRKFWSAASFYRRATHRDRAKAVAILKDIASSAPVGPKDTTKTIRDLATKLLREIDNEPDKHPPRAG